MSKEIESPPFLQVQGVCVRFGGIQALSDVSFSIPDPCILGLMGPNGAGKTTLFNLLTGIYPFSAGQIFLLGMPLRGQKPHEIVRMGLARTFQNIRLFKEMTVLENVMVGLHTQTRASLWGILCHTPKVRQEEQRARTLAMELLHRVGLLGSANQLAYTLPYGDQRRLEIARALATSPKMLALDEPAAGMNPSEREQLQILLQDIHQKDRVSLMFIEHDMDMLMGLCQQIVVLDYGRKIAEGPPKLIQSHPEVLRAYLGEPTEEALAS